MRDELEDEWWREEGETLFRGRMREEWMDGKGGQLFNKWLDRFRNAEREAEWMDVVREGRFQRWLENRKERSRGELFEEWMNERGGNEHFSSYIEERLEKQGELREWHEEWLLREGNERFEEWLKKEEEWRKKREEHRQKYGEVKKKAANFDVEPSFWWGFMVGCFVGWIIIGGMAPRIMDVLHGWGY